MQRFVYYTYILTFCGSDVIIIIIIIIIIIMNGTYIALHTTVPKRFTKINE